jgi:endonuclease YncB( thermonuclease family)
MKWLSLCMVLVLLLVALLWLHMKHKLHELDRAAGDQAVVVQVLNGGTLIVVVPVLVELDGVTAPDPDDADLNTQALGELARNWLTDRLSAGSVVTLRGGHTEFRRRSTVEDAFGDVGAEMLRRGLVQASK